MALALLKWLRLVLMEDYYNQVKKEKEKLAMRVEETKERIETRLNGNLRDPTFCENLKSFRDAFCAHIEQQSAAVVALPLSAWLKLHEKRRKVLYKKHLPLSAQLSQNSQDSLKKEFGETTHCYVAALSVTGYNGYVGPNTVHLELEFYPGLKATVLETDHRTFERDYRRRWQTGEAGFRATWEDRAQLCFAKYGNQLDTIQQRSWREFPTNFPDASKLAEVQFDSGSKSHRLKSNERYLVPARSEPKIAATSHPSTEEATYASIIKQSMSARGSAL